MVVDRIRRSILVALPVLIALNTTTRVAAAAAKTDLRMLGRLVRLPRPAVAAIFETRDIGVGGMIGPTDWELFAVIDFAPGDFDAVLGAAPVEAGSVGEVALPEWAALALGTQAERRMSGWAIRGQVRRAAAFAKSPLGIGFAVALDGRPSVFLRLMTT